MSRIGKIPVSIPGGVTVAVADGAMVCKGPKGELKRPLAACIQVTVADEQAVVSRRAEDKQARMLHGTVRSQLKNMVQGVAEGYTKRLEIQGVGYRAQLQGKKLVLNIGFCHQVEVEAPDGITFTCPDQTHIEVSGVDKDLVGQVSADIRAKRPPEPYKGKGIRYEGERVRRKAGKAGK